MERDMNPVRARELAQDFIDALYAIEQHRDGALEHMVELFSPMARLTNAALKQTGNERTGQVGARDFWSEYSRNFRDAHTEFFEVTTGERSAGLFWTTRGANAMGGLFEYDGASLLIFEDDGQIVLFRGYYDTRELSVAIGAATREERPGLSS